VFRGAERVDEVGVAAEFDVLSSAGMDERLTGMGQARLTWEGAWRIEGAGAAGGADDERKAA